MDDETRLQLCEEEMDVLDVMYPSELFISKEAGSTIIKTLIRPHTAGEEKDQLNELTLQLELPPGYPETPPLVRIPLSRSVSDQSLVHIINMLSQAALEADGECCVMQLIEQAKDLSTECNQTGEIYVFVFLAMLHIHSRGMFDLPPHFQY
jgi:hypothetical protein